jgi:hypothetical protein
MLIIFCAEAQSKLMGLHSNSSLVANTCFANLFVYMTKYLERDHVDEEANRTTNIIRKIKMSDMGVC